MKINYLYFIAISLFISCDSSELESAQNSSTMYRKTNYDPPFNSSNTFDYAGQIHNEILSSYYEHALLPTSLDSIISLVSQITKNHPYFANSSNLGLDTLSSVQVQFLLSSPKSTLTSFMDSSTLSETPKNSLKQFILGLLVYVETEESYDSIYAHITDYESSVISNVGYASYEKETILCVTSIVRHSIYMKKKKPKKNTDPDWDWLTTSIVGASARAYGDLSYAIVSSVVGGIIENK